MPKKQPEKPTESEIHNQLEAWVSDNIRHFRDAMGWNQSELARRMQDAGYENYNQMLVSRTEKGERPIRVNELEGFSRVFGVDMSTLLDPGPWSGIIADVNRAESLKRDLSRAAKSLMEHQAAAARRLTALTLGPSPSVNDDALDVGVHMLLETPRDVVDAVWAEFKKNESSADDSNTELARRRALETMRAIRHARDAYDPDSSEVTVNFSELWKRKMDHGVSEDS